MRWAVAVGVVLLAGCATDAPNPSDSGSTAASALPNAGAPNGVETLPAEQILLRAQEAALRARSVTMTGRSPAAALDLLVTRNASDGRRAAGGRTLQTRVVDGLIYVRAAADYWRQSFSVRTAERIGDKWVAGRLRDPELASFRQTSTMKPLMEQFLVLGEDPMVGNVGEVGGQAAVPVTSRSGTTWVATTGAPYVLRITSAPGTGEDATVDFSKWDARATITAPAKSNTIRLAKLT